MSTKAHEMMALSILAYRGNKHAEAAKLFTTAMESEGLDTLVNEIVRHVPESALNGPVDSSQNTIAPSLSSGEDLMSIFEELFKAESSLDEYDTEDTESKAENEDTDGDEDFDEETSESSVEETSDEGDLAVDEETSESSVEETSITSVGPIKFK